MASTSCETRVDEKFSSSPLARISNVDDDDSVLVRICALEVTDFSSQYGGESRLSYSASNLAGKANIYPNYGDFTQACVFRTYGPWWKKAPSAPKGFRTTPLSFCSEDYIELVFEECLFPVAINIYETYNPGAVVKILAADSLSGTNVDTGKTRWVTLWSDSPRRASQKVRIFSPPLKKIDFPVNKIRLELCHQLLDYYSELDCVVLCGTKTRHISPGYQIMQGYSMESQQNSTLELQLRALVLGDSCQHTDGKGAEMFERLPEEVILLILSYLDILSLFRLAQTCRLLQEHCYDHFLYSELDLQPLWQQVGNAALEGLASRCQHLQRLNLSWCGKAVGVTNSFFDRFLNSTKRQLTCLRLSCCPFVNNETLRLIATHCPDLRELDLSSCEQVDNISVLQLLLLRKLDRLNLYRTKIDMHSIICIIRACPELQHLNIGSCSGIQNFTEVAQELGTHCPKLKTLDLWRARSLMDDGLIFIANHCVLLEELDIGWCTELRSQSGCFVRIAENCKNLKKLFLTANRTVCDYDLLAVAKNSIHMQQFDILGTREVTCEAAERVLENCQELMMFDVSFCAGIAEFVVDQWRRQYPNISFKKSFQSS